MKTTGWNFRIMREVENGEPYYRIVEAHYNPSGYAEASSPSGSTVADVSKDIAWMIKALTLPVIDNGGNEVEPATLRADDMLAALEQHADFENILKPSEGTA